MALEEHTGTPPAVTHEKLVAWRKLSEDVTAALTMGGEQGLDLLTSLMAEWCEAVDDVNVAREICVNLAAEGRHDEAVDWHADGFFDVADLLTTDRAGWDAWVEALTTRNIPVPAMSQQLKELTDRIHEDRLVQDLSGRTLDDYVDDLRRNVLQKGHYGERLTHLEAIRHLDPAGLIWKKMIDPIRRKREGEIVSEFHSAICKEDFLAIQRLQREVATTRWDDGMPSDLQALVESCDNWRQSRDLVQHLSTAASRLIDTGHLLNKVMQEGGADKVEFNAAYDNAKGERARFGDVYKQMASALSAADRVPVVAERTAADNARQSLKSTERQVREVIKSIDRAGEYWKWLKRFRKIEADVHAHVEKAPLEGGSWDEVKARCDRWLEAAGDLSGMCRALESQAPIPVPASFRTEVGRFDACKEEVVSRKRGVVASEKRALTLVIGGVVVTVAIIFLFLSIAIARRS
jgi:hypothetical protein